MLGGYILELYKVKGMYCIFKIVKKRICIFKVAPCPLVIKTIFCHFLIFGRNENSTLHCGLFANKLRSKFDNDNF